MVNDIIKTICNSILHFNYHSSTLINSRTKLNSNENCYLTNTDDNSVLTEMQSEMMKS